ncbi:alpha/beta fold hydrolase [Pseudonocardia sp.]|jgi:pimeloyl-ACP methyl ester carboxylesterase|uniref:alpha/beta fold hydrolase n=1 Tax=Pseudonocardia sp. TaxID=60912 RepID=UPI0026066343|nr:alpha/beta fold hydrolase [Pseudonocardia sp.]MCW2720195.1 alpha/beta hydrolase fold protein [Pseudonocardia sp.]
MSTLYLHAVALDGRLWAGVARAGALTPDLPGHGSAPPLDGPVTMATLTAHVAGLLDGPADVVGISLGSMLAQQLAVHRPELVRSLVLASGGMATDPAVSRQRAENTRRVGMTGTLDATLDRWFTPAALADPDHPGVGYARPRLLADDPEVVAAYWDAMAGHDLREHLGGIRVPTTCIGATGDASVPVAAMRALAERVPGARMREIAGPHIVVLENGPAFAAEVERHLAWVDERVAHR